MIVEFSRINKDGNASRISVNMDNVFYITEQFNGPNGGILHFRDGSVLQVQETPPLIAWKVREEGKHYGGPRPVQDVLADDSIQDKTGDKTQDRQEKPQARRPRSEKGA